MATLTQLLDGVRYDGLVDTGTISVYALRFRKPDGTFLYVLWNLRGSRVVEATVTTDGRPTVTDTFNRAVPVSFVDGKLKLVLSDLPIYVTGARLTGVTPGPNVPDAVPAGTIISALDSADEWVKDEAKDPVLEKPIEDWSGMPMVQGNWTVDTAKIVATENMPVTGQVSALSFKLHAQENAHGLIRRYVSVSARTGKGIRIPEGTTRLGLWMHGRGTWAEVKIGVKNVATGRSWLLLRKDRSSRIADNFDGWRFVDTGDVDEEIASGSCVINRLVVTMPPKQVYVEDLLTTPDPKIAISNITAIPGKFRPYNYLPW
jgi:hypothetical protein